MRSVYVCVDVAHVMPGSTSSADVLTFFRNAIDRANVVIRKSRFHEARDCSIVRLHERLVSDAFDRMWKSDNRWRGKVAAAGTGTEHRAPAVPATEHRRTRAITNGDVCGTRWAAYGRPGV